MLGPKEQPKAKEIEETHPLLIDCLWTLAVQRLRLHSNAGAWVGVLVRELGPHTVMRTEDLECV